MWPVSNPCLYEASDLRRLVGRYRAAASISPAIWKRYGAISLALEVQNEASAVSSKIVGRASRE